MNTKRIRIRLMALLLTMMTFGSNSMLVYAAGKFDPVFYASTYSDVADSIGTDADKLYNHYLKYGQKEGRLPYKGAKAGESVEGIAAVSDDSADTSTTYHYVLNTSTKKFHIPTCKDISKMAAKNKKEYDGTAADLNDQGYSPCGHCHPDKTESKKTKTEKKEQSSSQTTKAAVGAGSRSVSKAIQSDDNSKAQKSASADAQEQTYVLNTNTHKFHKPSCGSVGQMKEENKSVVTSTRDGIISQGYDPCKKCNP